MLGIVVELAVFSILLGVLATVFIYVVSKINKKFMFMERCYKCDYYENVISETVLNGIFRIACFYVTHISTVCWLTIMLCFEDIEYVTYLNNHSILNFLRIKGSNVVTELFILGAISFLFTYLGRYIIIWNLESFKYFLVAIPLSVLVSILMYKVIGCKVTLHINAFEKAFKLGLILIGVSFILHIVIRLLYITMKRR